jgi:hypothetical protein
MGQFVFEFSTVFLGKPLKKTMQEIVSITHGLIAGYHTETSPFTKSVKT